MFPPIGSVSVLKLADEPLLRNCPWLTGTTSPTVTTSRAGAVLTPWLATGSSLRGYSGQPPCLPWRQHWRAVPVPEFLVGSLLHYSLTSSFPPSCSSHSLIGSWALFLRMLAKKNSLHANLHLSLFYRELHLRQRATYKLLSGKAIRFTSCQSLLSR